MEGAAAAAGAEAAGSADGAAGAALGSGGGTGDGRADGTGVVSGVLANDGRGAAPGLLAVGRGGANTGRESGAGALLFSVFADSVVGSGRGFSSPIRDVRAGRPLRILNFPVKWESAAVLSGEFHA